MHTLYVVATPIGNLEDIGLRAIRILLSTDVIACEDTRVTGNLIKILEDRYTGISNFQFTISNSRRFISIRDWNEAEITPKIMGVLSVSDVALVSDAGTPLISDPGFKIVRAARAANVKIVPIPGPSAGITALSAAGLPTNKFLFLGFLPKSWDIPSETTTIIYESPVRMNKTIATIYERYPEAQIVVAKELTKIYEEFTPGNITHLPKGESTILVYIPLPALS